MRNLSLNQKRDAVVALAEPVSSDMNELETLRAKNAYLKTVLRSLLIRSPAERKHDVRSVLNELDKMPTPLQLQSLVDAYYGPEYFRNEPDVEYKIALASALLTYMKLRVPTYNSPMLKAISQQALSASDLLRNFIEE